MGKRFIVVLLTAVFLLSIGGCSLPGGQNDTPPSGVSAAPSEGQSSEWSVPEVQTLDAATGNEEFDAYTEIFNAYKNAYELMTGRLADSLELYHKCAGDQEAFITPQNVYTCHAFNQDNIEKIEELHDLVSAGTKEKVLDQAFEQLYPSVLTLMDCLNEIYGYTDRKMYKSDDYAKGKEYHAALWETENRYRMELTAFETEFLRLAAERQMESVQYYQQNGRDMMSTVNLLMITAQTIQRELKHQGIEDDNLVDMDLEVIEPLCDAFIGYAAKVQELRQDQAGLDEEGFPYDHPHWELFLSYLSSTENSMTAVLQRAREQKPIGEGEVVVPFAGGPHLTAFDKGVAEMINAYTRMLG